jgi:2-amino-4-hydroxy-6-hydroxymethyldihydropteridine diphosphokinase
VSRAVIGLGANLGDPVAALRDAAGKIAEIGRVVARSSLYRTLAWGVTDQPPFVNAALAIETALGPYELLAALKAIERNLGRVASYRWGPRAIDLDILLYDDLRLDDPELTIPHARLAERAFALVPLAEIDSRFAAARDALPAAEVKAVERIGALEREESRR